MNGIRHGQGTEYMPKLKVVSKNIPTDMELEENNRSRSATLRIAEKIKE